MGAHPYFYFTPYQKDIDAALQALREQEFKAGRYDPALSTATPPVFAFQLRFPPDETWPRPGAQHASIEEAMEAGDASGTGSILDIAQITPDPDYAAACALSDDTLVAIFGTSQPNRSLLEDVLIKHGSSASGAVDEFWESIDRGQARYIVVYADGGPDEIFFVGYSWD
jgi:hypothetical protein